MIALPIHPFHLIQYYLADVLHACAHSVSQPSHDTHIAEGNGRKLYVFPKTYVELYPSVRSTSHSRGITSVPFLLCPNAHLHQTGISMYKLLHDLYLLF